MVTESEVAIAAEADMLIVVRASHRFVGLAACIVAMGGCSGNQQPSTSTNTSADTSNTSTNGTPEDGADTGGAAADTGGGAKGDDGTRGGSTTKGMHCRHVHQRNQWQSSPPSGVDVASAEIAGLAATLGGCRITLGTFHESGTSPHQVAGFLHRVPATASSSCEEGYVVFRDTDLELPDHFGLATDPSKRAILVSYQHHHHAAGDDHVVMYHFDGPTGAHLHTARIEGGPPFQGLRGIVTLAPSSTIVVTGRFWQGQPGHEAMDDQIIGTTNVGAGEYFSATFTDFFCAPTADVQPDFAVEFPAFD